VLKGAAAIAARLIERARSAPTQEALQIQRLLGLRGGGVDVPSLAAALSLPAGPSAVIAIGSRSGGGDIGEAVAAVRLHVSAYARESLVTATERRIYVVVPRLRPSGLATWLAGMLDRVTRRTGLDLRAAVAAPVPALAEIAAARAEVDRVLDRPGTDKITTLVSDHDQLRDPRLQTLVEDDEARDGSLLVSLEEYLGRFGDVRGAAESLHIHPNTLRYRVKRAERVLGMRLDDPEDRLLLQLQILQWRRSGQCRSG
jgi:DNA-binding PucR family transcriptional regulator